MSAIRRWLEDLGLGQYADAFEANDIDAGLLPRLNDQVLKDIGVASAGHRLRIFSAIEERAKLAEKPALNEVSAEAIRPQMSTSAAEGEHHRELASFAFRGRSAHLRPYRFSRDFV